MEEKNLHSYIFSFKIILFITGFLIIILFFSNHVPLKYDNRLKSTIEYLESTKDSVDYDVFFFSNSFIYTVFDPLYLRNESELNVLHFGSPSQHISYTIETIKNVLRIHEPKCIVIDLSKNSTILPKTERGKQFNSTGLLTIGFTWSKLLTLLKTINPIESKDYFLNSTSHITATINNLNTWANFKEEVPTRSLGYFGFEPLIDSKLGKINGFDSLYFLRERNKELAIDDYSLNKLKDFLEDVTSNTNVQIVFISSVKINSIEEGGFEDLVEGLSNISPNIHSINLNDQKMKAKLNLNEQNFYNSSHLNHSGALKVVKFTSPVLRKLCDKSKYLTNNNDSLLFNKNLTIRNFDILLEDQFRGVFQFYLDSIPSQYVGFNTVLEVFPKPEFKNKLLPYSIKKKRKSDIFYLPLENLIKVDNELIGTILMATQLKKREIEKIELWFYKSKGFGSGRKVIYLADAYD